MDASLKKRKSCKSFNLIGSIQTIIHPLEKQTQKNLTHKMSIIRGFEMIKIETAIHAITLHKTYEKIGVSPKSIVHKHVDVIYTTGLYKK